MGTFTRLVQRLERYLDMVEIIGSNPILRTHERTTMKIRRNPFIYDWPEHRYKKWYGERFPCLHCNASMHIDSEDDINPFTEHMCYVFCPFCLPKHRIVLMFNTSLTNGKEYLTWFQ